MDNGNPNNVEKKKNNGSIKRFMKTQAAVVVTAAVFGTVTGVTFNYVAGDNARSYFEKNGAGNDEATSFIRDVFLASDKDEKYNNTVETITTSNTNSDKAYDVSDISEKVMPSIVAVNVKGTTAVNQGMFGIYEYEAEGSGSGIIIGKNDSELLIVTNNHVVSSADTVSVTFIDEEACDAKVKGIDSESDIAILAIDLDDIKASTMKEIKIAKLGNSDEIKVGEQVVAIGNALGYGQSVTTGIVSAKNRECDSNAKPLIQTDAAINPGNSGGALLNMKGEVIGINSSKFASTEVEGMGYAIPISQVEDIIDNLSNKETREKVDEENKGYLGISCATVDSDTAKMYNIPTGVYVSEVSIYSGAGKAGIPEKSIITKLDGQSVQTVEELTGLLDYYAVGDKVPVTYQYLKGDKYTETTVVVTLTKKGM